MHRALLICNSYYTADPAHFPDLLGPQIDGVVMWDALTDPETGVFAGRDVTILNERRKQDVLSACEIFFSRAALTDDLLFYFSGHGVLGTNELFLAATDSVSTQLTSTAVSTQQLSQLMSNSRAKSIVVLLDCCYSGAFKGEPAVPLGGTGRFVISSSTQTQVTPDAAEAGAASPFTALLTNALRDDAVADEHGEVSIDEVFKSIEKAKVPIRSSVKRDFDGHGSPVVAKREPQMEEVHHADRPGISLSVPESEDSPLPLPTGLRRVGDLSVADLRTWGVVLLLACLGALLAAATFWKVLDTLTSPYVDYFKDEKLKTYSTLAQPVAAFIAMLLIAFSSILDRSWQLRAAQVESRRQKLLAMDGRAARWARMLSLAAAIIFGLLLLSFLAGLGIIVDTWVACISLLSIFAINAVLTKARWGAALAVSALGVLVASQFIPIYAGSTFVVGLSAWTGWMLLIIGTAGLVWWALAGETWGYVAIIVVGSLVQFASAPQAMSSFYSRFENSATGAHWIIATVAIVVLGSSTIRGCGRKLPLGPDRPHRVP